MIFLFILSLVTGAAFAEFKMPYIAEIIVNQSFSTTSEPSEEAEEAALTEKVMMKYEIKDSPQGKVLGEIMLKDEFSWDNLKFYPSGSSVGTRFIPNIDFVENTFYHQVVEVKGDYVNLGDGPWGKIGWAEMMSYPLIGDRVFYFTDTSTGELVEYLLGHSKQLYKRKISTKVVDWESIHKGVIEKVGADEPILKEGLKDRFIFKNSFRNEVATSGSLDLTNGELNLLSSKTEVSVTLYSKPDPESPQVGTLIFRRSGDTLTSFYVEKGKKEISFKPSIYEGRCGKSVYYLAIQPFTDSFQNYSMIGEGPWGKNAWVTARHFAAKEDVPGADKSSLADGDSSWTSLCEKSAPALVKEGYEPRYIDFVNSEDIKQVPVRNDAMLGEIREISVHVAPSAASKKIGKVIVSTNEMSSSVEYIQNDGKSYDFEVSLLSGICDPAYGSSTNFSLHQVASVSGNWSNLGKGEWGDEGWVNIGASALFRSAIDLEYKGHPGRGVAIDIIDSQVKFTRQEVPEEDSLKFVPVRDLVDSEGRYRFSVYCEPVVGC